MAQLKRVVDPFGEVNVYPAASGKVRVTATILMTPHREGAQTGIALDGSGSMAKLYGIDSGGGVVSSLFAKKKPVNEVGPVAQKLCAYLARRIDSDNSTTCIFWSTGDNGAQVEHIADFTAEQAERYAFGAPREFGTGTQLLPAVRYFVERFRDAPWGFYVFITDGELHDLDAVKEYSTRLARDIAARRRHPVKFVLIGLGPDVNERQIEELDDLDTGTDVDLWDHKLAAEMRILEEIFAEVVDRNARVAPTGCILDPQGRVLRSYESGLPAFLEFEVPQGTAYFTLDANGTRVSQALSDTGHAPAATVAPPPQATPPPLPPAPQPAATPPPLPAASQTPATPPPLPAAAPPPPKEYGDLEHAVGMTHGEKDVNKEDAEDQTWRLIDFGPPPGNEGDRSTP